MQPTTEVLARIRKDSISHGEEVFTRLYRYLLRPDIYFLAYMHLYANNGAGTKGVSDDTADGFSEKKIERIIDSLKSDTYQPSPVRRTYIEKKNNPAKKRPLGIPTFTDKLVQEVLRMILEAIYEPVFLDCSHGFRSNRSCHTALRDLKHQFHGTRWFVEGDIKGCFDNIDHAVLISVIGKKIKDARLIRLIYRFLKAGYMEDWRYNQTFSGTPQGGIISPLLANIYLHELDQFVMTLKSDFDKPAEKHFTYQYGVIQRRMKKLKAQAETAEGQERENLIREYKQARKELLKTPCKSQTDKVIKYIRYADDFLIGVNGTKEEAEWVKQQLASFISTTLKMELSQEKTLITHSNSYARFLGYDVRVRRDNKKLKPGGASHKTRRSLSNMTELCVPFNDKIRKFLFAKGIVEQKADGTLFPVHRKPLVSNTDLEIVMTYNSELRGICNYYSMASNFCKLSYFAYLMEYSCLKTLAAKHKSTVGKMKKQFRCGKRWGIPYQTKRGTARCLFAEYAECKGSANGIDTIPRQDIIFGYATNSIEKRLKARVCELCGTTDSACYEIHHVNKVKNLKGKEPWERAMIAKRRKTLVVCQECHYKIHGKSLNSEPSNYGKPDTSRGVSPVSREDCANLPQ